LSGQVRWLFTIPSLEVALPPARGRRPCPPLTLRSRASARRTSRGAARPTRTSTSSGNEPRRVLCAPELQRRGHQRRGRRFAGAQMPHLGVPVGVSVDLCVDGSLAGSWGATVAALGFAWAFVDAPTFVACESLIVACKSLIPLEAAATEPILGACRTKTEDRRTRTTNTLRLRRRRMALHRRRRGATTGTRCSHAPMARRRTRTSASSPSSGASTVRSSTVRRTSPPPRSRTGVR
jgi:hypothetical protein